MFAVYCMFIFNMACVAACECDCKPFPFRSSNQWINFKRYRILFIAVSVPHPFYKILHKNKKEAKQKKKEYVETLLNVTLWLKSDPHPPKRTFMFASMTALQKWWTMSFTSS